MKYWDECSNEEQELVNYIDQIREQCLCLYLAGRMSKEQHNKCLDILKNKLEEIEVMYESN